MPSSAPNSPSEQDPLPLRRSSAEELARTLRTVADPTRLQLLSVVLGSADKRVTVGRLAQALGLTQPTVTHHVRIMVDDELLVREKVGKYVWLSVAADRLAAIEDLLR